VHELAIAEAVVSIAEEHARGRRVVGVDVRVGHLRQVVPSALGFSFELVAEGTVVEGAELRIVDVPVRVECRGCGAESDAPAFPLVCASCGGLDVDVIAGDELLVESLELEDEPVMAARR
jgi:hydrogenase nickel incorporation protein HypA/HybF